MGLSIGAKLALIPFRLASSDFGHIDMPAQSSHMESGNRIEIAQRPRNSCEEAKLIVARARQEIAQIQTVTLPQMISRDNLLTQQKDLALRNLQSANTNLQNLIYQFRQIQERSPNDYQRLNQLQNQINQAQWQVNLQFQEHSRLTAELNQSKSSLAALTGYLAQLSQVPPSYNARFGLSCGYVQNTTTYLANHPSFQVLSSKN